MDVDDGRILPIARHVERHVEERGDGPPAVATRIVNQIRFDHVFRSNAAHERMSDLWIYHLDTGKSQQITHSLVRAIRSEDMVEQYLVHYPSRDGGWTISTSIYLP